MSPRGEEVSARVFRVLEAAGMLAAERRCLGSFFAPLASVVGAREVDRTGVSGCRSAQFTHLQARSRDLLDARLGVVNEVPPTQPGASHDALHAAERGL